VYEKGKSGHYILKEWSVAIRVFNRYRDRLSITHVGFILDNNTPLLISPLFQKLALPVTVEKKGDRIFLIEDSTLVKMRSYLSQIKAVYVTDSFFEDYKCKLSKKGKAKLIEITTLVIASQGQLAQKRSRHP
jgi:hypothetical protein